MSGSVVVTGGSRGLGLAIARRHLERGDRVALIARDPKRLEEAARSLGVPERVALVAQDVRNAAGMHESLARLARDGGGIGRVYANAGAIDRGGPDAPFDRGVFETNTLGVVNTAEAWLATQPAPGGAIGVISSFSAFRGLPHLPAYGASKAAVTVYAESLRGRLSRAGLRVTTIFLGYLDSELASGAKPRLLVTPCDTAARVLVEAVDRGRTRLAYPWTVRALVAGTRALPDGLYDRLVARRYRGSR